MRFKEIREQRTHTLSALLVPADDGSEDVVRRRTRYNAKTHDYEPQATTIRPDRLEIEFKDDAITGIDVAGVVLLKDGRPGVRRDTIYYRSPDSVPTWLARQLVMFGHDWRTDREE